MRVLAALPGTARSAGAGGPNPASGNTVSVAVDLDNKRIWYRVNGGSWNNDGSADPVTNTNGKDRTAVTASGNTAKPAWCDFSTSEACVVNFGSSALAYAVPSGFTAGWPA